MITVIVVGLLAGVITSISPCVLPVLPVVLAASVDSSRPSKAEGTATVSGPRRRSRRPYLVIAGLVISFCLSTLFGTLVLSALGLPQTLLRDAGIAVLIVVGVGLVIPRLGELLERPFSRLPKRVVNPGGNGLVIGLSLGLLFVPCAGPVLATIAVLGATHRVGPGALVLTAAFGLGAGLPLLGLALAGDAVTRRTGALRRRARGLRIGGGVVMILVAAAIALNLTDGLQRHVAGYTAALQNSVESNHHAAAQLHKLTATDAHGPGDLGGTCSEGGAAPENCGRAPAFTGIDSWLNTPGDRPLTLNGLRGKVVLIDFWTYSCINCQRTLPHVEAWYREYAKDGFEVIGVHTPEFAFEHVRSNVRSAAASLGVKYPVALDNEYGTWDAYSNQYWPAEYLIDADGNIRHVAFGEGDYAGTENLIRRLITQSHPEATLASPTDVPTADLSGNTTGETYLGSHYAPLHSTSGVTVAKGTTNYDFPAHLDPDGFALSGTWTEEPEDLVAGTDAKLELSYRAHDVYLVLGGSGTVTVRLPGQPARTVHVSGVPKLYTLADHGSERRTTMTLTASRGIQAYDFTFG